MTLLNELDLLLIQQNLLSHVNLKRTSLNFLSTSVKSMLPPIIKACTHMLHQVLMS